MRIYIDSNFCCHTTNQDGNFLEFDVPFFDNKCDTFVEGYRFVPAGESWTRSDGVTFFGEMITPWKDWRELDAAQREYEQQLLAQYEQALSEIEVALGVAT